MYQHFKYLPVIHFHSQVMSLRRPAYILI